nr:omega-6 fatty acid desaturase [Tanacetum cinerariifolium]
MGAGGRSNPRDLDNKKPDTNVIKRAPTSKPPFTLADIKKAIPSHCFERSMIRSFSYLVADLTAASIFYYVATTYIPQLLHPLPYLAWPIYWFLQVAMVQGFTWVFCAYGGALMVMNAFVVTITYLHHTHPSLPHYDDSEWNWMKGAFSTIDRDYGVLNKVFHNITDTHVLHHLFSYIPHYHAMEATKAIRPIMGEFFKVTVLHFLWRYGENPRTVFSLSQMKVMKRTKASTGTRVRSDKKKHIPEVGN